MKIACLAWGSLLWKWDPLPLGSEWRGGGPPLPLEFTRVGDKAELSPALCQGASPMPTWWALVSVATVDEARELLRRREQVPQGRPTGIGSVPGGPYTACVAEIDAWRKSKGLNAVVWTALPPRFNGDEGCIPTADEAVAYLDRLEGEQRSHARRYIERMPPEFATRYRASIEQRLGWQASSNEAKG